MVCVDEKDYELLREFIKREAEDFTPNKDGEWRGTVFREILKKVESADVQSFRVRSYGNAGGLIRELMLDTVDWKESTKDNRDDLALRLCPCGRLDHTVIGD